MATKEEVLEKIARYGQSLGEERVERIRISDEWENAKTLVFLLLIEPKNEWYRSRLDDEETREAVLQKILLLTALDKG